MRRPSPVSRRSGAGFVVTSTTASVRPSRGSHLPPTRLETRCVAILTTPTVSFAADAPMPPPLSGRFANSSTSCGRPPSTSSDWWRLFANKRRASIPPLEFWLNVQVDAGARPVSLACRRVPQCGGGRHQLGPLQRHRHGALHIEFAAESLTVTVRNTAHMAAAWVSRVGISSMRGRAAEVGGTLRRSTDQHGSLVRAVLPIR